MLFNSFVFLLAFLPASLLIYHWLRVTDRQMLAKLFLVGASIFFYGWWDVRYVPLVLVSIAVNFGISLLIERKPPRARLLVILGLALNLGLLGYYKYANFFVSTLDTLGGFDISMRKVVLPLAISFFTFQQIAYLVEVYKDRKAADSLTDYSLFVLFFPHLIAGPITHHKEMLPQFKVMGRGPLPYSYVAVGLGILVLGLFKKSVVADSLAAICNPIFHAADQGHGLTPAAAWLGALAYTFQLYFDFSGYSDMAIGLGLMFGIRLPVNFASPYKSLSIIEFWRRWHISLSRFLRNYIYIPLGGNRKGEFKRHLNLMITMALGGLWHGAGWTFLLWGVLHGTYLVCNHFWSTLAPKGGGRARAVAAWLLTFLAVVVAWVLFRATTLQGALSVLHSMAGHVPATVAALPTPLVQWLAVLIAGVACVWSPNVLELANYPDATPGLPIEAEGLRPRPWRGKALFTAVLLGVAFALVLAKLPDPGIFLYFNF
jgi:alginate O-acetyltransferase complex protein AlgI